MSVQRFVRSIPMLAVAGVLSAATLTALSPAQDPASLPLVLDQTRITVAGTSNVHDYTASTTAARITRVQLAPSVSATALWAGIMKPGAIEAMDVVVPAATLSSPREGLDKNMHKALKVNQHPEITFRLGRLEGGTVAGSFKAIGTMQVAGVRREVAFDINAEPHDSTLVVTGEARLLMTDFGIAPPKAMLGMLKTDPKITVTFETRLAVPLT